MSVTAIGYEWNETLKCVRASSDHTLRPLTFWSKHGCKQSADRFAPQRLDFATFARATREAASKHPGQIYLCVDFVYCVSICAGYEDLLVCKSSTINPVLRHSMLHDLPSQCNPPAKSPA